MNERVEIIEYNNPTPDIQRFFLGLTYSFVNKFVFDGKIDSFQKFSISGSQINVCDYPLSKKLCLIGVTYDVKIYILIYNPSNDIVSRYAGQTYEEIYGEERESEANDYITALTAGGRLSNLKAKDVMYALTSEYVIDTIFLNNLNPKIKLYDNAVKFAETITNYTYKYINRRISRIEFVEKEVNVKCVGSGVEIGHISNDPYLLLNEVNKTAKFPLNKPCYAWIENELGQDELAIYTANENYNKPTYKELVESREDPELRKEIDKLSARFSSEAGYQVPRKYITSVIKKLNKELIVLPIDFIRRYTQEAPEYIEPLRYKFSVIKNRREFEGLLYNSIENNINGRYKYRFVEKLSGIYLTIGNKLNYNDSTGKLIKKQSIADFNINFNATIIKRETIVDSRSIPQLLGYMYNDYENRGTDMLPVPSVEVVFYFPDVTSIGKEVEMYNGTSIEQAKGDGWTSFSEIGNEDYSQIAVTKPKDPNEKYVTVRYINSDNEILKENIIRDLPIGSIYTPEIIPIINDKSGREWHLGSDQIPNVQVSNDNDNNIVEVRYVKKMASVRVNYINKQGAELSPPAVKNMQVGESLNLADVRKFKDKTGTEWNLYQTNPAKFIVSEESADNVLTLIYDVIRADVFISYKTRDGVELKPQEKIVTVANQEFKAEVPREIVDKEGLLWEVGNDSKTVIFVTESDVNVIELFYDEKKARVVTTCVDESGAKIKDDVVELVQIGKIFIPKFENDFVDVFGKWWKLSSIDKQELKVNKDESINICTIKYEKVNSVIHISMINEQGSKIKDDIIAEAQIGMTYSPEAIGEIEDVKGLIWQCVDNNKSLKVSDSEMANKVEYRYKPYITTVYFRYVDDEGNDLLPQKERQVQAGSMVSPEFISTLNSKDQRGWILSKNNEQQFKVSKHKEENIFKINYDKKLVKISLSFKNVSGAVLKDDVTVDAQIGSEYQPSLYDRITANNGERWMIAKTEPAVMFVRENSHFTLVYDEIRARITIKCINIADETPIVNDQTITYKLGGSYATDPSPKIYDSRKCRWIYVGEPSRSIIAKENDEENIIVFKYEPDVCDVTLRFINNNSQLVHKDIVKPEQIGKEISVKETEKIIEENGMGWLLENMSRKSFIVDEDKEKNIVTSTYVPLIAQINTRYIDNDGNELCALKAESMQVGKTFVADILPKVKDNVGRTWAYSNIKVEPIKIKDELNKVNIKYVPLMKNVTSHFVNLDTEVIYKDKLDSIQVGTNYQMPEVKRIIDDEGKYWIFQKLSREKIVVSENEEENIVEYKYDKELVDVTIKYSTEENVTLEKDKVIKLQIGSKYTIEPPEVLRDGDKLAYIVSKKNQLEVGISPNKEENIFNVVYEKYIVHVYDKFINNDTGEEIIKPIVTEHQVGSSYLVTVKETIIDEEGKHWLQAARGDSILFGSSYKVEPIIVQEDEDKNFTVVKYKPKLALSIIKYLDPYGNPIKPEEQKKLQIGSKFGEDIPTKIVDRVKHKWSFNPKSKTDVIISEDPNQNIIELSYEESKGTITYRYLDAAQNEIIKAKTELIQIGNEHTPQFDMIVTDDKGCVWEYQERDRETLIVSEKDEENIVNLTFIPLDVDVLVNYLDLWGNEISPAKTIKAQLGSNFKLNIPKRYENESSLLYKVKSITPESIIIKEIPIGQDKTPNEFTIVFDPIVSNVIIKYNNLNGEAIREDEIIELQVGSKYTPEPAQFIKDKRGSEWELINAKKEEVVVFENQEQNILTYSYDVAKTDVIIRFINVDGVVIKEEERITMQIGQDYIPKPEEYVLDEENRKWKMIEVDPVSLKVGSINNIVTVTYQEAKAKVTLKYIDEDGNIIKNEERVEAQIGSTFTPKITNKVIYSDSDIWRMVKLDPKEIVILENSSENIVNVIYSNSRPKDEEENKKPEFVNPFANTLNDEESEELRLTDKDNTFDTSNIGASEDAVIFSTDINTSQGTGVEEEFEFEDSNLQKLGKEIKLTNGEKIAINELNEINSEIVKELRKAKEAYDSGVSSFDYSRADELIAKEKQTIKDNMEKIIAKDKTGSRMLKIYEHIVASEAMDPVFGKVQQKKAIIVTDCFVDKAVDDIDKARYICERGKNTASISIIERKISSNYFKNLAEANELKTVLFYEKMLLDNYYKSRTLTNDSYFTDASSRETLGDTVNAMVEDMLAKQARTILQRENMTIAQQIEVESIITISTPSLYKRIEDDINNLDNKSKKNAKNILKEMNKK